MAKSGKKQTANQKEFAKQVRRIQSFVKRAEKRGYTFDKNPVPATPKRITKAAIRKARELTPEKLYGKAKYKKLSGEVISGSKRRQEERKAAARAGKAKKQRKEELKKLSKAQQGAARTFAKYKYFKEMAAVHVPTRGELIIQNLYDLISKYDTAGSAFLKGMLDNMIAKYGKNAVAKAIEQVPVDLIEEAQNVTFYDKNKGYNTRGVRNLAEAIRGYIFDEDEAIELNKLLAEMEPA